MGVDPKACQEIRPLAGELEGHFPARDVVAAPPEYDAEPGCLRTLAASPFRSRRFGTSVAAAYRCRHVGLRPYDGEHSGAQRICCNGNCDGAGSCLAPGQPWSNPHQWRRGAAIFKGQQSSSLAGAVCLRWMTHLGRSTPWTRHWPAVHVISHEYGSTMGDRTQSQLVECSGWTGSDSRIGEVFASPRPSQMISTSAIGYLVVFSSSARTHAPAGGADCSGGQLVI